jgi:hypothetical protein
VNNAIREIMSHLKDFAAGTQAVDAVAINGDLTVDTNTLVVDSTNNRVGIGDPSPTSKLDLGSDVGSSVTDVTNHIGLFGSQYGFGITSNQLNYVSGADHVFYNTSGNERVRILGTGGLTFNGDTAAANALSDFETGSWTPTYTSTGGDLVVAGYALQFGRYVKIGKMCQVNGGIQTSGITTTGTGDIRVSGLPFNIANLSGGFIAGAVGYSQNFLSVNPQSVLGFPNTDTISFRYNVTTDSRSAINGSINTSNLSGTNNHNLCWFSITYTATA